MDEALEVSIGELDMHKPRICSPGRRKLIGVSTEVSVAGPLMTKSVKVTNTKDMAYRFSPPELPVPMLWLPT